MEKIKNGSMDESINNLVKRLILIKSIGNDIKGFKISIYEENEISLINDGNFYGLNIDGNYTLGVRFHLTTSEMKPYKNLGLLEVRDKISKEYNRKLNLALKDFGILN